MATIIYSCTSVLEYTSIDKTSSVLLGYSTHTCIVGESSSLLRRVLADYLSLMVAALALSLAAPWAGHLRRLNAFRMWLKSAKAP